MTSEPNLDEVVHQRTQQGQQAAISSCNVLEPEHASVLLLFNGFTPTDTLLRMAAFPIADADVIVSELERQGLIARV